MLPDPLPEAKFAKLATLPVALYFIYSVKQYHFIKLASSATDAPVELVFLA